MLLINVFLLILTSHNVLGKVIGLNDPDEVIVELHDGKIKGRKYQTIEQGRNYYGFKGIPYGEPPVGQRRFAPPEPKQRWHNIWDTTKEASPCVQSAGPVVGSEDCLYLNVYTPRFPFPAEMNRAPVMVWFSPGGFQAGLSDYDTFGPDYFLDQDVIVVTFNYRLGIFGFLSTGDLVAPGNNGLKDQLLAVKWVNDNIKRFGGDPDSITIFGQSAGSASVSYMVQSKKSRGYFQKAIMESGTSFCLWTFSRHNLNITYTVGSDLNITTNSSRILVEGLKKIDYELLQTKTAAAVGFKYLSTSAREGFFFAPVLEPEHPGAYLTEKSHELISKGDFHRVPMIVGYNSLEGTFQIGGLLGLIFAKWDFFPGEMVPIDMNVENEKNKTLIGVTIKLHYFGFLPIAISQVNLMTFLGDDQFARPIREYVRVAAQHAPLYFYRFDYKGGLWGIENRTGPGVGHSEELGYLWVSKYNATQEEALVRSRMIKMWTNFAKNGNPTPSRDPLLENVIWLPAKTANIDDVKYLNITNHLELGQNPDSNHLSFWKDIYRKYSAPPYDTY